MNRLRNLAALALVAWALSLPAKAQTPPPAHAPIPVESFFRNADIRAARLSPSGRWLGVTTGLGGARIGLVVFDLQARGPATQVVRFEDADIGLFYWVNENRLVFDLVDLHSGGGDQRFVGGLYGVRPDGSGLRQLIRPYGRGETGRAHVAGREPLSWNHTLLHVPIGGGDAVIVGEWKFDGVGDLTSTTVKRLDLESGRPELLSFGAPPNAQGWLFDPKGEPRLVESLKDGVVRVSWRAPGRDSWTELARFDRMTPDFVPRFVDTSGELFVTTGDGARGTAVVKRFDFKAGRPQAEALVSTPGFDFDGDFVVDSTSGRIMGVRADTDAETTVWFDSGMKALQLAVDSKLPGRINRITCRRCDSADAVVLAFSWSDQDPGRYWVYRPKGESWALVGAVRPDIDPQKMGTLDLHRIQARDGNDLPVWVTMPPRRAAGAAGLPAVVLVHGGPFVRGGRWRWDAEAQFLASRGYVVIEPEFRGSAGFGDKHLRAGWKQWGLAMQDDLADAVSWAVAKGLVDAKRVCIAGASYGGYATLMGLVRHPELYRCGAAWAAVTDPRLMFEKDWTSDLPEEWKKFGLSVLLGDPVKDAAALAAVAPVEQAARIKAPVLLAFGQQDSRVPIAHGSRMRAALRAAGNDPEWVTYASEGHGWQRVENRVDFARRIEAFLARNLH